MLSSQHIEAGDAPLLPPKEAMLLARNLSASNVSSSWIKAYAIAAFSEGANSAQEVLWAPSKPAKLLNIGTCHHLALQMSLNPIYVMPLALHLDFLVALV